MENNRENMHVDIGAKGLLRQTRKIPTNKTGYLLSQFTPDSHSNSQKHLRAF